MKTKSSLQNVRRWTRASLLYACLWSLCVHFSMPALAQAIYSTPYTFTTLAGKADSDRAGGAAGPERISHPRGLAVDTEGNVYVANTRNHTICRITPAGGVTTLAGRAGCAGSVDGTGSEARFCYPQNLAVDEANILYVADSGNNTIRRVTPTGAVTTLAGLARHFGTADGTGGDARFNYPNSVAVDCAGNIYVADLYNATIRKVTRAGVVTTLAGKAGSFGSADGKGSAAQFNVPACVAVDSAGNVYVADSFNNAIRKVTSAGEVTTLVGKLTYSSGSVDATGSAAQFFNPCGLAIDNATNVYVADGGNHTIRRVTAAGTVTTLAGLAGHSGSADGTGSAARFWNPISIALDRTGNLYVADLGNAAIRKGTPARLTSTPASRPADGSFSFTAP